jgi:hypothetical protein
MRQSVRSAFVMSTSSKLAALRFAQLRSAPLRFAPLRFARRRSAPLRFTAPRFRPAEVRAAEVRPDLPTVEAASFRNRLRTVRQFTLSKKFLRIAYCGTGEPSRRPWRISSRATSHVLIRFGKWREITAQDLPADRDLYCNTVAMMHYAKGYLNVFASRGESWI